MYGSDLERAHESQAISRAQQGDPIAFEWLYNRHKRRVYSLCVRMVGNRAKAEELTQDTFLQVYRRIKTFRGDSAFSTWLHRIAVNVVLMTLRRERARVSEISLEAKSDSDDNSGLDNFPAAPAQGLSGWADRINLERAVRQLPPGYGIIFLLHDVEGYQHDEIAEILGCSVGNTKSQLHKARVKLRKYLLGKQPPSARAAHSAAGSANGKAKRSNITARSKVLLLGRDRRLLQERCRILRNHDLEAVSTTAAAEASRIVRQDAVDVVLVSERFEGAEARKIAERLGREAPQTPVVLLSDWRELDGIDLSKPHAILELARFHIQRNQAAA